MMQAFNKWKQPLRQKFTRYGGLIVVSGLITILLIACRTKAQVAEQGVYPQGRQFPLALYSIHLAEDMQVARKFGWNIAHRYSFTSSFLQTAKEGKMLVLAKLPGESQPIPNVEAAKNIAALAKSNQVAWWDFPEERRYWRAGEMALITNYAKWTRKYDSKKRPNYMYIPGHYDAEAVQQYVPYLDVVPASIYTNYMHMPHAWVRWRMETTLKGIKLAGATIGPDYFNGEKTPVAVLELFHDEEDPLMTPQGAYHDFWQSIVSGAKGILIFSYWHKRDHPALEKSWHIYNKAAAAITGSEQLGSMILYGKELDNISFQIAAGPKRTNQFTPYGMTKPISFPSIDLLAKTWDGNIYIIAVNSAEKAISARLTGLPKTTTSATILFENKIVPVTNGVLKTQFTPLGVHIFKLASSKTNRKAEY